MNERLRLMRKAARVVRFHTMPTTYMQSVGEHTFGVLAIAFSVGEDLLDKHTIKAILYHDAPEAITGDTPSTAKWRHTFVRDALDEAETAICVEFGLPMNLGIEQRRLLKFCDLLELAIFSMEEADTGNKGGTIIAYNALAAIEKKGLQFVTKDARELYESIKKDFDENFMDKPLLRTPSHLWPPFDHGKE